MIAAPEGARIADVIADQGIRLKSHKEATALRARCPKCDGGREREDSLTLSIDAGGKGAVWNCHRSTCGWTDNIVIGASKVLRFRVPGRTVRQPAPIDDAGKVRNANLYRFFTQRKISHETVDAFDCHLTTHWFHAKGDHAAGIYPAIVFPFLFGGETVNRKYRSPHRQLMQEKDPLPTLFNIDAVKDTDHVVWVEGETDCMACFEAGWHQTVSLKDGAPTPPKPGSEPKPITDNDRRFDALLTHADLLAQIEKIYLAGDADAPGRLLMEEVARRLGRHRCWLVEWPEGRKDAGEVLQHDGIDVLNECIHNAKPYPIEGVQEVTGRAIADYLLRPPPPLLTTGLAALDQILRLPGEGRVIVVTGMPNAGKSPFLICIMMHLMMRQDRRFLVFSPEMQPWEEFSVLCAQVMFGKPARRHKDWKPGDALLTRDEQIAAGDWLNQRMRFLSSDADDKPPTLEWILDRGTESALRLGITDVLIDPWNEIEHQRGAMSETDYTGRALQRARAFGYRHGCNVWVIVHPVKMRTDKDGALPPPGPYDISGSAHFANKADIGITLHRPEETTKVILWKSRFYRWGKRGTTADLFHDPITGRYSSPPSVIYGIEPDAWDEPL